MNHHLISEEDLFLKEVFGSHSKSTSVFSCHDKDGLLKLPSVPMFLRYPSHELGDLLSVKDLNVATPIDMGIVHLTEHPMPEYPKFDDLDSLGMIWWNFGTKTNIYLINEPVQETAFIDELFEEENLSITSELPEFHNHSHKEPAADESDSKAPKRIGCRCGMSKCLRLHCRCFRDLEYCAKNCKCTSCFNNLEHEEARAFVISKTKEINKNAFTKKVVKVETQNGDLINSEGCTCKTGCNRNYCECFKNKTGCSPLCKCANCKNQLLNLVSTQIKSVFKPVSRKKNKIIISSLENKEANALDDCSFMCGLGPSDSFATTADLLEDNFTLEKRFEISGNCFVAYQNYKKVKETPQV